MQGYPKILKGQRYVVTADVFIGWKKGDTVQVVATVENKKVTYQRVSEDPHADVSWKTMSTSLFRAMFSRVGQ